MIKKYQNFLNEEVGRGTLHNVWRSKVFTKKGKKIGFPNEWSTFKGFKEIKRLTDIDLLLSIMNEK